MAVSRALCGVDSRQIPVFGRKLFDEFLRLAARAGPQLLDKDLVFFA